MNPDAPTADIPVVDASSTQAELDAKISEELGLPEPAKTEEPDKPAEEPDKPDEEPAPSEPPEEPATDDEEPAPAEEPEPAAVVPAQPSDEDLFIEVEDANGVTHKISKIEDLPPDFEPAYNRQVLEIFRDTEKLNVERDQRVAQAEKDEEAATIAQTQTEQFKSWDNEIAELSKAKRVDIKDTDYLNDVFGYMNEVNNGRREAGNPNLISSFEDALDKYEAKQATDKAKTEKQNDNSRAKLKTAVIGKSSAAVGADHYVYRAGSARNIDDIPF